MPVCWIIAGPNGAGKTTFALEYLPSLAGCENFINADLIAAGLSPLNPDKHLVLAGRLLLDEIDACIERGVDFSFETTLSGRGYLRLIDRLKSRGWQIELIYLALPQVEMSKLRVAERVFHGGHGVPEADLERRFSRSLYNLLKLYAPCADRTRCFMNTGQIPELVFEEFRGSRNIIQTDHYEALLKQADLK
ncbi:MAG: hypothetical protein RIR70_670 [Pseudomonadota bacterium]|jgi:predicted ABC-type ATPase